MQAMTTGSIGGFLDVLFNFNTQALLEDNIIGELANSYTICGSYTSCLYGLDQSGVLLIN